MLRINDTHSVPLIARVAGVNYVAGSDVTIAHYDSNDRLTSGVMFTNSNNWSSEIHVASFRSGWTNKELLWFTFHYAFRVRKWGKLFGRVPDDKAHEAAFRLDAKLGFMAEAYINDVFGYKIGLHVLSMYREDCKWLDMKPPKITFPSPDKTLFVEPDPAYSLELS